MHVYELITVTIIQEIPYKKWYICIIYLQIRVSCIKGKLKYVNMHSIWRLRLFCVVRFILSRFYSSLSSVCFCFFFHQFIYIAQIDEFDIATVTDTAFECARCRVTFLMTF